jgi:hypothetical protein
MQYALTLQPNPGKRLIHQHYIIAILRSGKDLTKLRNVKEKGLVRKQNNPRRCVEGRFLLTTRVHQSWNLLSEGFPTPHRDFCIPVRSMHLDDLTREWLAADTATQPRSWRFAKHLWSGGSLSQTRIRLSNRTFLRLS